MKKVFLLISVILMFSLLTGCMAGIYEITINSQSSIDVSYQLGVSQDAINMMGNSMGDLGSMNEMTPFTYNGKTYCGEKVTKKFATLEEFGNFINSSDKTSIGASSVDTGYISVKSNSDGSYELKIEVTNDTADTSEIESDMELNGVNRENIKKLMEDMVLTFTFKLPTNVTQTTGNKNGIIVTGNKVIVDFIKLDKPTEENEKLTYTFVSKAPITKPSSAQRFIDVPETLWSFEVINKMAEGGLVKGVGEGRFSPERAMKISEFCQLITNAKGLESGDDGSGYWAAKAIKSCIDAGYIFSHGEINPENYEGPITREEAIAAMQIASGRPAIVGKNIQLSDIPDGMSISDRYKDTIIKAYNSGITNGVNDQLKFSPKNNLTRGQVCQLFCNVNWTRKMQ